jgi:hypothetical protein
MVNEGSHLFLYGPFTGFFYIQKIFKNSIKQKINLALVINLLEVGFFYF